MPYNGWLCGMHSHEYSVNDITKLLLLHTNVRIQVKHNYAGF